MDILNFVEVSETIGSSGQPKENEFEFIKNWGATSVINLAMPDSDNAIANEGQIVSTLGMSYLHIPVVWTQPKRHQYDLFESVLNVNRAKKVWVHCALNFRVSCFIYLYKVHNLDVNKQEAYAELRKMWEPNETWSTFIGL